MRVSGFTFVRNGIRFDYPFIESLRSLLPLCDEVVVAVGNSDDGTRERLLELHEPKLRLIDTTWDESLRVGGRILAQQTDVALNAVTGDWAIYLQGDEVLHEKDYDIIRAALASEGAAPEVEGFLLRYLHFYGGHSYIGDSRRWYRREVRIIRNGIGVQSWGDAQGFRIKGRKLRVRPLDADVYHYGWVKPPAVQQLKQRSFNKLWHSDEWVARNVASTAEYDYARGGKLKRFEGTHPSVMRERVVGQSWTFTYDPKRLRLSPRERFLELIERTTGWRIGEYRNYELL